MKYKYPLLAVLMGLTSTAAIAQDTDTPDIDDVDTVEDPSTLSTGEQKVLGDIADDFSDFAGDDALPLAEALRTGGDLEYTVETEVPEEVPVLDADGNPVYKTNPDGTIMVDADGNPIPETTIVEVPVLDADGNPVYKTNPDGTIMVDAEGNPIPETTVSMVTVVETVNVENSAGPMGMGNVKISMLLAEEMLKQDGVEPSLETISGALFGVDPALADGILELRADGGGWGQISKEVLGVSVGSLMSAKNKGKGKSDPLIVDTGLETDIEGIEGVEERPGRGSAPEKAAGRGKPETTGKPDKAGRPENTGRPETAGRPENTGRPERVDRPEKSQRPERVERPERPERPEKIARPERPERPERVARPEKPERPDRPQKVDRPSRPDKPDRPNKPNRPNKPDRPDRGNR